MIAKLLASAGLVASFSVWGDVTVHKQCEGYSFENAKQNCFNEAIDDVVGQVIVRDREAIGDRIVTDNLAQYNAGYINGYKILNKSEDEFGFWQLEMTISVADSKIAHRKLDRATTDNNIDGRQQADRIKSILKQRQRGDQLLSMVLESYPYNTFIINSGNTDIDISPGRNPYIMIPYKITVSKSWLSSFNEALGLISAKTDECSNFTYKVAQLKNYNGGNTISNLINDLCGSTSDVRILNGSTNSYYLHDQNTLALINSVMRSEIGRQKINVRVDLVDRNGITIDSRCGELDSQKFIKFKEPNLTVVKWGLDDQYSRLEINGDTSVEGSFRLNVSNLTQISELSKIKLTVENTCQ